MTSKWRTIQVEEKELEDRFCNKCGKSVMRSCGPSAAFLTADWGFDSHKDCEKHTSHLCEACYDEIVATFAVQPAVFDLLEGLDEPDD